MSSTGTPPSGSRTVIATLVARAGQETGVRAIVAALAHNSRRESGCIEFRAFEAKRVRGRFYIYEIFADEAALQRHLKAKHLQTFLKALTAVSSSRLIDFVSLNEVTT